MSSSVDSSSDVASDSSEDAMDSGEGGFVDWEAEEGEESDASAEEESDESGVEGGNEESDFIIEEAVDVTYRRGRKRPLEGVSESDSSSEGSGQSDVSSEGSEHSNVSSEGSGQSDVSSESEVEGVMGTPGRLRWKEGLSEKAREAFERRRSSSASLRRLIYSDAVLSQGGEEEDVGGLFHVTKTKASLSVFHGDDSSVPPVDLSRDWSEPVMASAVKSLFVTGSWGVEDAKALLEEDMFGDFEDLETGEKHEAAGER